MTARRRRAALCMLRGPRPRPAAIFLRCYGPEFAAKAVQQWITAVGARAAYIAPGSPWENEYVESLRPVGGQWQAQCHPGGTLGRNKADADR